MKNIRLVSTGPSKQANAHSTEYSRKLSITYGNVIENNTGTCNVELKNGFVVEDIRIQSTTFPSKNPNYGGIIYPPIGAEVLILHPENDLKLGWIIPASLDFKDESVLSEILSGGDKQILPGGWVTTYDQETGNVTFTNGDFSMTVNNTSKEIALSDWNGNEIQLTVAGILLKSTDAANWKPNTLAVDPFTGVPHGGVGAGITKLKGG
jgi:hypothetical protein